MIGTSEDAGDDASQSEHSVPLGVLPNLSPQIPQLLVKELQRVVRPVGTGVPSRSDTSFDSLTSLLKTEDQKRSIGALTTQANQTGQCVLQVIEVQRRIATAGLEGLGVHVSSSVGFNVGVGVSFRWAASPWPTDFN